MGVRYPSVSRFHFARAFRWNGAARALSLCVASLCLPGCAAGLIGAILGASSGGGGGGGSGGPATPTIAFQSVEYPGVVDLPPLEAPASKCTEAAMEPLLGCNLSPEEQAAIETKFADALGFAGTARQSAVVRFNLDREAAVAFRVLAQAGEVDSGQLLVDGAPIQGRAANLSKGPHTVQYPLGSLGTSRREDVVLELAPEGGEAVPVDAKVDNRPPVEIQLCGFQPGFSCPSNPTLKEDSVCTLFIPPGGRTPKLKLGLFKTDATGACATSDGEVIDLELRPITPPPTGCPANFEGRFQLPSTFDCESASIVVAVAEVSGLESTELGTGPSIRVSEAVRRIDSSAPEIADLKIQSFQPGSRVHAQDLFGIVVIDYTVKDRGGEPVNLDISVTVPNVGTLRASEGTLSEAVGLPCEGVLGKASEGLSCLATSAAGTPHRFLWNVDRDFDRLVRERRLTRPRAASVKIQLAVKDPVTERVYSTAEVTRTVDNAVLHTVAGLQPGQTRIGDDSVSREQITFETLSGIDIDETSPGNPVFYFVDSGTHTLWSWRPGSGGEGEVSRLAGTGSLRIESPSSFDGQIPINSILRQPIDVLTDGRGVIYVLERSGRALWKLTQNELELLLDESVLRNPEQMALDDAGGILYIADSGNCRILRCDFAKRSNTSRPAEWVSVIAGDLRELEPEDLFRRLFADSPDIFEVTTVNGCNFRDLLRELNLDPDGVPLPGAGVLDTPEGIAFHSAPSGKFLLISDTGEDRIVRAQAEAADPGATFVELLDQLTSTRRFCSPSSLKILFPDRAPPLLFVALRGFVQESVLRGAKGIVIKSTIIETGANAPTLGAPQPFAGLDDFSKGDCGAQSQSSNYAPVDECLPATRASLSIPREIAADGEGIIYLCDSRNQQVRKIGDACTPPPGSPGGSKAERIQKLFGSGVEGLSSCEVKDSLSSLCSAAGIPGESAVSSRLNDPLGLLLFDDSHMLVTDRDNGRLRLLNLGTGSITTLAGRQRTPAEVESGTTFGGDGGPALNALFDAPRATAVSPREGWCSSPERKIYLADTGNNLVRVIDANGNVDTAVGIPGFIQERGTTQGELENLNLGNAGLFPRQVILKVPKHVLVDSQGRLFISDSGRHRIIRLVDGIVKRVIGTGSTFRDLDDADEPPSPRPNPLSDESVGDGQPPLLARLNNPNEMAFDADEEHLYFCDGNNNRVRRVGYNVGSGAFGGNVETVVGSGSEDPLGAEIPETARRLPISFPYGLAFSPDFQYLYVTETFGFSRIYRVEVRQNLADSRVCRIAGAVTFGAAGDGDDAVNAQFTNPNSMQIDAAGNIYILDGRNHRLRKFFPVDALCSSKNP